MLTPLYIPLLMAPFLDEPGVHDGSLLSTAWPAAIGHQFGEGRFRMLSQHNYLFTAAAMVAEAAPWNVIPPCATAEHATTLGCGDARSRVSA